MDLNYLLFLQKFREATGGIFNGLAIQISDLSYGIFIWLTACIFFWAINKRNGSLLFLNVGLSRFLMQFLKLTFCVYRPYVRCDSLLPLEQASGYSFPSGHSVTAAANYGTLAKCYKKYRPIVIFLIFMIVITIFSRNYIGVHTPQDVLAGTLLGTLVVLFSQRLWDWVDKDARRDYIILAAGILLSVFILLYISLKSYPTDYADGVLIVNPAKMVLDGYKDAGRFFGLTLGWFLERRFVRFSLDVTAPQKVMRCCAGAFILILFEKTLIPALAGQIGTNWGYFIMMAIELLVLTAVYLWLFQKYERSHGIEWE